MSERYPGGFITKSPPALNPALGNAAPGIWTMDQVMQAVKNGTWPAYDPYFEYTTLLLHGNGTNGAQNNTFLDASTNNFTITRNGNTTQGTFSPYGSNWSNYFDGSGDYLSSPDNTAVEFGAGDFTIEAWAYPLDGGWQLIIAKSPDNSATGWQLFASGDEVNFYASSGGGSWNVGFFTSGAAVKRNAWNHIAVTRSGSTWTIWVNGVSKATATSSITINNNTTPVFIGTFSNASYFSYGYVADVRIVKGTAVYTSAFTPPTAPLTAISGTSLLTCQSNRFVDNSTNAFTITRAGDVSVQRFSPFAPTAAYSAATIGGSGYFDGSGDYLLAPASSNLEFGSGDFTIEFWWYTTVSTRQALYHGSFGTDWSIGIDCSSQKMGIWASSTGTSWNLINADPGGNGVGTITVPVNQWNHIAYVRSGTTWMLYVNGVRDLNLTGISGSIVNRSSDQKAIGAWWSAGISPGPTTGYIQDFRILKGTALYTGATYTVPTAPLTAITNTQLLLNFTNAAIFDNAMMNDLETVGNAQISTSVVKFGTGSIYLDGTGDWLIAPSTPNCSFETGDFTIEGWLYPTATTGTDRCIWDTRSGSADAGMVLFIDSSGKLSTYSSNAIRITSTSALTANTWQHFALVRSSGTMAFYIGGTQSGTLSYSSAITCPGSVRIGVRNDNAQPYTGYIDDLRITKGYARYTANFTPPTSQLQDQ